MADMRAVSALAARLAPNKPVVAAGHSYGSVMAAIAGGALADRGGVRDPSVRAVAMLSSPGVFPGLVTESAYSTLQTPLLLTTGDADVVPGMVPDWRAHLRAYDSSPPGDKLALIAKGGGHFHSLNVEARPPAPTKPTGASLLFFRAHALGDASARRQLAALRSTDVAEVHRR